jgi:hypothetical protein
MLMNSEFALSQANRFAMRLQRDTGTDPRLQVARAFEIAFARPATQAEVAESVAFLERQAKELKVPPAAAGTPKHHPAPAEPALQPLTDFCQALISSNEFLYSD